MQNITTRPTGRQVRAAHAAALEALYLIPSGHTAADETRNTAEYERLHAEYKRLDAAFRNR